MSLFVAYKPEEHGQPAADLLIRAATPAEASTIAAIWVERHGGTVEAVLPAIARHLQAVADGTAPDAVFVALLGDTVVGFGRCGWRAHAATGAADGWYLLGLNVLSDHRRRGVGRALAQHRLDWLRGQGAGQVFSFVSTQNLASLALHRSLGFEEVTRAFTIPGAVSEAGGSVLLCRGQGD